MRVRFSTAAALAIIAVACDRPATAPNDSQQPSALPPSASLTSQLSQADQRTPFQRSVIQTIAERQAQGLPVPTASYEYQEVAPAGIVAAQQGERTIVARTVIAFENVAQAGLDEWPALVVSGDLPPGVQGTIHPGDYTQFAKDQISKQYPDAWSGVSYEAGPRTYTVAETLSVSGARQPDELMKVDLQGLASVAATDQVLLGFTLNGPGIDYHVDFGVDICIIWFFGCQVEVELVDFWAGFVLDWTIATRLPMAMSVTSPTTLKEGGTYPLTSTATGRDWGIPDFEAVGVNAENGNEFVLKFEFGAGVFLTVAGYDAVNIGVQPMSLDRTASFATPLGPGQMLTLPTLNVPIWGFDAAVADASIGLLLTPTAGSDRYTADWLATGEGSGSGTATYTTSGAAVPLGTVAAVDGPGSAGVQLSGFRYYFSQFYLDLGIEFTFHVLSWGNAYPLSVTDFDLSSVLGKLYVEPHSGTAGVIALEIPIENVAPTVTLARSGAATIIPVHGALTSLARPGDVLEFTGAASDPGRDDITLRWDWNDGAPAPDHSTTYPVPYHVTERRTHAFDAACLYSVELAAVDDDAAVGADHVPVVVTGARGTRPRLDGYWQHQFAGNGHSDLSAAELACYLGIVTHMSTLFGDQRPMETAAEAHDVLFLKQNGGVAREQLDRQLLVAWLNFAAGAIGYDDLVDQNGDGKVDTPFGQAMAAIEAARLNSQTTEKEIQKLAAVVHAMSVTMTAVD